jgi:hypothetical protein
MWKIINIDFISKYLFLKGLAKFYFKIIIRKIFDKDLNWAIYQFSINFIQ